MHSINTHSPACGGTGTQSGDALKRDGWVRPGLVSITFRNLPPREITEIVAEAQLCAIEWGGDVHVPHGDLVRAREVGRMTCDAGLSVAAYGSYYEVGRSEAGGLGFAGVLETALALGAPLIRVWAGSRSPAQTDAGSRESIVTDARRIAALAERAGMRVVFEFHGGTLTETADSTVDLLRAAHHPALAALWQPPVGMDDAGRVVSLRRVLPLVCNLHVFHWGRAGFGDRRPLEEGRMCWSALLALLAGTGRTHYALLEYVAGDTPESFRRDARMLREMISDLNGDKHVH